MINLQDDLINFYLEYTLSNKTLIFNDTSASWKNFTLDLSLKQTNIIVGNKLRLVSKIFSNINRIECENDLYLCVRFIIPDTATFTSSDNEDDIFCLDLINIKNCTPGL